MSNEISKDAVECISVPRQPLQAIYEAILSGAFYENYDAASKMTGWLRAMLAEWPLTDEVAVIGDAAQIAIDQESDEPWPGSWNDACRHIAHLLREADRRARTGTASAPPQPPTYIRGEPHRFCDCDPANPVCALGLKRVLETTQFARCMVPASYVIPPGPKPESALEKAARHYVAVRDTGFGASAVQEQNDAWLALVDATK